MVSKEYLIQNDDEIPLASFMDEFGIRPEEFDVRKFTMKCTVDYGWYGESDEFYIELCYEDEDA